MRRVHVVNGIMQRLNDIFGTQLVGGAEGDVTSWSVQAAMLSNINRLISAMVGNAPNGRVMKGLELSFAEGVFVSPGYALTANGGIITVTDYLNKYVSSSGTFYVYLKHNIIQLTDPDSPGYKSTGVINDAGNHDIVFDEQGMAQQSSVVADDILILDSAPGTFTNNDWVYLGKVVDGVTTNTVDRGMYPNTSADGLREIIDKLEILTMLNVYSNLDLPTPGTGLILTNSNGDRATISLSSSGAALDVTPIP